MGCAGTLDEIWVDEISVGVSHGWGDFRTGSTTTNGPETARTGSESKAESIAVWIQGTWRVTQPSELAAIKRLRKAYDMGESDE
jgi:hypothetical protein